MGHLQSYMKLQNINMYQLKTGEVISFQFQTLIYSVYSNPLQTYFIKQYNSFIMNSVLKMLCVPLCVCMLMSSAAHDSSWTEIESISSLASSSLLSIPHSSLRAARARGKSLCPEVGLPYDCVKTLIIVLIGDCKNVGTSFLSPFI